MNTHIICFHQEISNILGGCPLLSLAMNYTFIYVYPGKIQIIMSICIVCSKYADWSLPEIHVYILAWCAANMFCSSLPLSLLAT